MPTVSKAEATLLRYRLDKPVGGSGVAAVDVIIVDLTDSDGATGLGFTYVLGGGGEVVLRAAQDQIARFVQGKDLVPPAALWRRVAGSFNRTGLGPNLVALAALDVAAWDLEARRRGVPLGVAMGGVARSVPVYGSGGFTASQAPEEAAEVAAALAARGFGAVKPRMRGARIDRAVMAAVRGAIPDHVHMMVDANEKCDLASARWLLAAARDHDVLFVEEPIPANDLEGYRALAAAGGAPIATGEHLQGQAAFLPFLSNRLAATVQPDLAMAGGLTPVLQLATLAEAFGIMLSPHFLPGLFVQVAAAAPALGWLEEFPLLEPLFEGWPEIGPNGTMAIRNVAGHGLALSAENRRRFAAS